jgi:hypothetical protein
MDRIPVALPPHTEQYRIVAKVAELMALCHQLEANLTDTADTRSRLLDALLSEDLSPLDQHKAETAETSIPEIAIAIVRSVAEITDAAGRRSLVPGQNESMRVSPFSATMNRLRTDREQQFGYIRIYYSIFSHSISQHLRVLSTFTTT